jgi:predicted ATPase
VLVGRDAELAALRGLLGTARVVTVAGVGGVGKTALARAAVADAPLCELAAVEDPDEVATAVAAALGFPSLDAAVVGLARAELTVVIDNCEHVLDAAAAAISRLVAACPAVTVLATSREPLDVPGERVLPLAPLDVPAGDDRASLRNCPAVQLLLARAGDAGVEIGLDAGTAPAIAALTRRLDGLPLAIELAAARTRSLTPAEILAHLQDRLDLLTRSRERGPARHRSLEAAIGWSHGRLPEPTRRFFDRLGVFAGRFTAETAQAVAAEPGEDLLRTVGHLDLLVGQSLLTVRRIAGRSWYGLLDTLREFARARLAERGELAAVQDRWVGALEVLARDAWAGLNATNTADSWSTAHAAEADLRAAVRRCLERDTGPDRAVALLRPFATTVHSGSADPIAALGEAVISRWPDRGSPLWATAAAVTAYAHAARHDLPRAAELAGLVLAGTPDAFAAWQARRTLAAAELTARRPGEALRWADEAVSGAAAAGLRSAANEAATLRALVMGALDRTAAATEQARAAGVEAAALGSGTLQAWAGLVHGCLVALTDPAAACTELEAVAARSYEAGYPLGEGAAYRALGAIALEHHDHAFAAAWLSRALEVFVRMGRAVHLQVTLRWTAALARATGRPGPAETLRVAAGEARMPATELLERAWLDPRLPATADGPAVPLPEAVALAHQVLAETATAPPAEPADEPPVADRFALEGAVWAVTFAGRTVRLPDSKGMQDLATLLARPGREVHCTELVGAAVEQADTGEVLDAQARRRYEARIVELQGELAEAEEANDRGRAEAVGMELDLLVDQLVAATGLHGRSRKSGGTAERARTAVTWRIRAAIRRADALHPALGAHLRRAVRTGTWCSYQPEQAVEWEVNPAVGSASRW